MAKAKQTTPKTRKLKGQKYKSFKLSKRIKNTQPKLPSSATIFKQTYQILKQNWRFFFGISLVYGILLLLFVRSVGGGVDVAGLKDTLSVVSGQTNNLDNSFALFGILLSGSATNNNEVIALYQTIIMFVTSLAIIWGLRQAKAGDKQQNLKAKKAFYKGMYPLVPVLLVLLVIGLELLPISFASSIYSATVGGGLAVTFVEKLFWAALSFLLVLLSLYLVSSSIFALFIAALPDMAPMRALRSARKLVLHRRFEVMRKLVFLPLVLLILLGLVIIPLIAFIPSVADAIFFIATVLALPFILGYIYNLYRSLL